MEYDLHQIMSRAWSNEKAKGENNARISDAKTAAGITEETNTWVGCMVCRGFPLRYSVGGAIIADE